MKKLFYLLLALPLVFAACEPESDPVDSNYVLSITSSKSMEFGYEGGNGVIKYELQEDTRSAAPLKVEATCEANWITDLKVDGDITFVVAPNSGAARNTKVVVAYGAQTFEVAVAQRAKSTVSGEEIKAVALVGQYYTPEQLGTSTYCYYFMLTDKEYTGEVIPNASYFMFCLYSDKLTDGTIPHGTYTFDVTNSTASGTIEEQESYGYKVNAAGDDIAVSYLYTDATVTVSDNKIVAEVTSNGKNLVVTYEGTIRLAPYDDGEGGYSTLTGDLTLNLTDMAIEASNYADYYDTTDANNWYIQAMNSAGKYITLDLLTDASIKDCSAEYHVLTDMELQTPTDYINSYVPGYIYENYIYGCWYCELDEQGNIGDIMAPFVGGTIKIEVNGNKATITFNSVDDAGNKITGTISGSYTYVEPKTNALSVGSSKPAHRISKSVLAR